MKATHRDVRAHELLDDVTGPQPLSSSSRRPTSSTARATVGFGGTRFRPSTVVRDSGGTRDETFGELRRLNGLKRSEGWSCDTCPRLQGAAPDVPEGRGTEELSDSIEWLESLVRPDRRLEPRRESGADRRPGPSRGEVVVDQLTPPADPPGRNHPGLQCARAQCDVPQGELLARNGVPVAPVSSMGERHG